MAFQATSSGSSVDPASRQMLSPQQLQQQQQQPQQQQQLQQQQQPWPPSDYLTASPSFSSSPPHHPTMIQRPLPKSMCSTPSQPSSFPLSLSSSPSSSSSSSTTTTTRTAATVSVTGKSTTPISLLDLPIEILEEILCYLSHPRALFHTCRQLYLLSTSTFLRSKYLLAQHGCAKVLTRKVIERDCLAASLLNASAPVVLLLINLGAHHRDPDEFLFRWACAKGHVDVVRYLLQHSVPRIDLHRHSDWFLREAAEAGEDEIVRILLSSHDPHDGPTTYGLNKAFERAYMASHISTVKILIEYAEEKGKQIEQEQEQEHLQHQDHQQPSSHQRQQHRTRQRQKHTMATTTTARWRTMSLAAIKAARVKSSGLDISSDDDRALRYAAQAGDTAMVRLLLEYGANVHSAHDHALLVACKRGHVETTRALIQAGADFDLEGLPLRYATEQGDVEMVRLLCESGAGTHWGGCNALRGAAQRGHAQIIAILLDHGADVNIHEGMPLQLACQNGHEEAVKVLLEYGADHRLEEGAAYRYALEGDHERIMSMLIDAETRMRAKEQQEEEEEEEDDEVYVEQEDESLEEDDDDDFTTIPHDLRHPTAYLVPPQATSSSSSSSPWPGRGFSLRPSITTQTPPHARSLSLSATHGHPASAPRSPISPTAAASPYRTHYHHRPIRPSPQQQQQQQQQQRQASSLHRGHKRFYSQISSSLAIVDLLRTGSLCGLVALDDEIRSRQRNDHQRL